jgi:hypothetical protein
VYIWEPFNNHLLQSDLIAQNVEAATNYYEGIMKTLEKNLKFFPTEIINDRKTNKLIYAHNAGILGGHNIEFFKVYAKKAFDFINKNIECFPKIVVQNFNIFFEQYLFSCLAKNCNINVNVLFSNVIGDNEYIGFGDFIEVPHKKKYLHLLGTYKRNHIVCEQLGNRLRNDYPEYYYRIISLFKHNRKPLKRDYYHFINNTTESHLVSRNETLKALYRDDKLSFFIANNKPVNGFIKVRSQIVKKFIKQKIISKNKIIESYKEHLSDLDSFESQLQNLVRQKFLNYSMEYLYARDLEHLQYFQILFDDKMFGYDKKIKIDIPVEIIESKFDWSEIDNELSGDIKIYKQLNALPSKTFTAVIPECNDIGYSLINIDSLDLMLLQLFHKPVSINEVLREAKAAFDPAELETYQSEFELLIIGRIKTALQVKMIKLIN